MNSYLVFKLGFKDILKLAGYSILGFFVLYLGKIWHSYRFFSKLKVKTPKHKFLYGNLNEIMKNVD